MYVDLFLKGDINQDGKVSQDELNFVSAYKKDLTTIIKVFSPIYLGGTIIGSAFPGNSTLISKIFPFIK